MKKIDSLLRSIEQNSAIMEQRAVVLDGTPIGTRVRPTYAHRPEMPTYIIVGKEFQPEIENGILYSVAYYQLKNSFTGEMHHRLVAAYEIVLA